MYLCFWGSRKVCVFETHENRYQHSPIKYYLCLEHIDGVDPIEEAVDLEVNLANVYSIEETTPFYMFTLITPGAQTNCIGRTVGKERSLFFFIAWIIFYG